MVPSAPAILVARNALAAGDPLRALSLIGRLDGAHGLLLRGIAYAQLGDLELAYESLAAAEAQAEAPHARARARAALVEIALNGGDPAPAARNARACAEELAQLGDARNAAMLRLVMARAEVLLGRLGEARHVVEEVLATELPTDIVALACLAQAEIAVRALAAGEARSALTRARRGLEGAPHPLLERALAALERELLVPIARILRAGAPRDADLFAIEDVSRGQVLLVDACRKLALSGRAAIPLARRPVLFGLLLVLGRAWPAAVARRDLATQAFGAHRVNESHLARLRVEIGRLRKLMDGLSAEPIASGDGYVLSSKRDVVVLLPLTDEDSARVGFLLADGASWSARGLAEHAGISKRTAQRALAALVASGSVVRAGKGNGVRYARLGGTVASRMLLLGLLPTR